MFRSMGLLLVAAGLAFSACGSREKKNDTPAPAAAPVFTPAPDEQALVGAWSDGTTTLRLNANQSFTMEVNRGERNPQTKSGRWSLRGGALYLHPEGQLDEVYDFSFSNEQRSLGLSNNKQNASWNLTKR